ncbi:MAG: hypothetical protein FWD96_02330 [Defluviitaleaceae bacterium]|nr:hypothetical protein [Defluviitaleaceae bacterium]
MIDTQTKAIQYIQKLSESRLNSALDYLRYLYEQDENYPLDEFDYELSRRADEAVDNETVSFDEVMLKSGLTYEDIQDRI